MSEPEYVAILVSRIRDACRNLGIHAYAHARGLSKPEENKFGCDGMIILRIGGKYKVCLFEAKWPRLSKPHIWDYLQKDGTSHFNSQIRRQHIWRKTAAIWEMFLVDEDDYAVSPRGFDPEGATCVWHSLACQYNFPRSRTQIWQNPELRGLVGTVPKGFMGKDSGINIREMLLQVSRCRAGRKIASDSNQQITLRSTVGGQTVSISVADLENENVLGNLTGTLALSGLLFVDLDDDDYSLERGRPRYRERQKW